MVDIKELKVGDKVYHQPSYFPEDTFDNGIVKEIPDGTVSSVRVVYYCGGDWENYKNYTSALTRTRDLFPGWKHNETESNL